ncbi:menaquinone biosynthetic enzyme MqnA/MqnD family protein [Desulfovibrio inopinatus]|uniref:menaquinone biosynthetic enzyme MqnA/MqnD family protein n=1 Tax=Desulfovibrio inopinatus TaxID=102109 RepID=UPI0009FCE9D4|nr:menaquinone biosynthesis protein [Desulfovibrio inopinatus]
MKNEPLRIGRIRYLNVWPLFEELKSHPIQSELEFSHGHPEDLNNALLCADIDVSPSSSFLYLKHAEHFQLLPDISISATTGPIQSVLFLSPLDRDELTEYVENGGEVGLTTASASSIALLRVLWRFHWKLPEPKWINIAPGTGVEHGIPCLEIGDIALKIFLEPPDDWHIFDLGTLWHEFTGLPFVFAVWIARVGLSKAKKEQLRHLGRALDEIQQTLPSHLPKLIQGDHQRDWISPEALLEYFDNVGYDLSDEKRASLILFGEYCRQLGLIDAVPGLSWVFEKYHDMPETEDAKKQSSSATAS